MRRLAARWDAAIFACHAALKLGGGARPAEDSKAFRTKGGEIVVGRTRGGRLQLRRSPPGRMTAACEQAFLGAVAASANIRLSAAATGFTHSAFYQKMKKRPAFASESKISLAIGYDRLEFALSESAELASGGALPGEAWRGRAADTPLPPMTVAQALQLLHFHRNTVRLEGELRDRRRAEPGRLVLDEAAGGRIRRKFSAVARARHYEETGSWRFAHEQPPPALPPLHLVTGWSKATGKPAHNPDLALFGGWRIGDWHERKRRRG
jgi:hypothetical protein